MKKIISLLLIVSMLLSSVSSLAEVTIQLPAKLKNISAEAFQGNSAMSVVDVPYGSTSIDSRAFADSGIWMIYIPSTVIEIAEDAFDGCQVLISSPEGSYAHNYALEHGLAWVDSEDHYPNKTTDIAFDMINRGPIIDELEIENLDYLSTDGITDAAELEFINGYNAMVAEVQPAVVDYNLHAGEGKNVLQSMSDSISDAQFYSDKSHFSYSNNGINLLMSGSFSKIGNVDYTELAEDGETLILYSGGKKHYASMSNGFLQLSTTKPVARSLVSRSSDDQMQQESEWLLSNFEIAIQSIDAAYADLDLWLGKTIDKIEKIANVKAAAADYLRGRAGYQKEYEIVLKQLNDNKAKLAALKTFSVQLNALNVPFKIFQLRGVADQWHEINRIFDHKHPNENDTSSKAKETAKELKQYLIQARILYAIDAANGTLGLITSVMAILSATATILTPPNHITAALAVGSTSITFLSIFLGVGLNVCENYVFEMAQSLDRELHTVVTGVVYDAVTGQGMSNVAVQCPEANAYAVTDSEGGFNLYLKEGTFTIKFVCAGYKDYEIEVTLADGEIADRYIGMELEKMTVSGFVMDLVTDAPLANVKVSSEDETVYSESDGYYSISLPMGSHYILFTLEGYDSYTLNCVLGQGENLAEDIGLQPSEPASTPTPEPTPLPPENPKTDFVYDVNGYGWGDEMYFEHEILAFAHDAKITDVVRIPAYIDGWPVTRIRNFSKAGFKTIIIPDTVYKITGYCEYDAYGSFICVRTGAFAYHEKLETVVLSENLTEISDQMFYSCFKLQDVTIPDKVKRIGEAAFFQCFGIKNMVIPDSVESIGEDAFANCPYMESIDLPSGLTEIPAGMLNGCVSLKSIIIPSSVTKIGKVAFTSCNSVEDIDIPSGVTTIEDYAFWSCDNLKSVTFPASVISLGKDIFDDCVALETVYVGNQYVADYMAANYPNVEVIFQ